MVKEKISSFKFGKCGAIAAVMPAIVMAKHRLAGLTMKSIKRIFNDTTSYILTKTSYEKVNYNTASEKHRK